jgi:imidazoleglycerol-phosphate dehydratase
LIFSSLFDIIETEKSIMEGSAMRSASIKRKTNETDISLEFVLDGEGRYAVETGIGFLDHMLSLFARHGSFDLKLSCLGDLDVDAHHTVEDIGIVIGQAIAKTLENKEGINRYGTAFVPMDEALVSVCIDISNRPYLVFNVDFKSPCAKELDCCLFEEFFRALTFNAGITLHVNQQYGQNSHHIIEAVFKAFSKALLQAVTINTNIKGVMSTKGMI